jgi:hypothetical protein
MFKAAWISAGVIFLVISSVSAGGKPDFSGEWTLNKEKSKLENKQASNLEQATLRIEHREPLFKFHRTFTLGGKEDILSYELPTDGKEATGQEGEVKTFSKLYWEGDTLVYSTRLIAPWGEATNIVHYRLLDNGRLLQAEEQFRGRRLSYDNLWVFEKK